ncbi:molybdopterin molybdotransferase MoeA [Roseomonas sp. NAR14]|uniref:Molybdopterin molybdenumtransferase n=1 Tax=Roseomonas acroporae TaxID=2937791 RepID=A0A9X1Y7B8_9PROT|nr:gephyrin-like molybdotransferase Glp [Roseomonas acroporae]MCK8783530.1 molybdopterin molybdotransferase MoeA [Roseomonas acroporae]
MIPVEEARERILRALSPTAEEVVPLPAAWGRVLARPVVARLRQPPQDVSAMDGYAVRAADAVAGARLRVVGTAPAGHPFAGRIGPGEAVRLFTGAFVPAGADAVVIQEDTTAEGEDSVLIREPARPGRHVRRAGLDFATGETLLEPGRRLTARDVGLAAAANHPWLTVHRQPRIGILATGDEIFLPGEPLPTGGIVSSNSHALSAVVRAAGGDPLLLPIAPDDTHAIAAAAMAARHCDLLLTTGGASVGDHDLIQAALGPHGFALDFWKIAMRPGKPLIWGRLGDTPVLGLPGNPVSTMVCAVLFLLPALARLAGLPAGPPPLDIALAGTDLAANDRRLDHLRARTGRDASGRLVATPFPTQDSSMMATLARAEALIVRPAHAPAVPAGAPIEVILLERLGI